MRSLLFILSVFPFFFDNCIFASDSEEPDIRAIERSFRPSKQIRFHDTSSDEENRESEDSDSGMPKNSNDRIPECFFSDYSLDGLVNNQLTIPFSSLTHEERSSGSENLKTKTPVKQSTSPRSPSQSDPRYNKKSEKSVSDNKTKSKKISDEKIAQHEENIPETPSKKTTKPHSRKSDPVKKTKKKTDTHQQETLEKQRVVSQSFINLEKRKYLPKEVPFLLIDFMNDYSTKKVSTLDITGLSSRSRIYLLISIINFKINFLPTHNCSSHDEFCALEDSNEFWGKKAGDSKDKACWEFVDNFPTTFKIGDFLYKLKCGSTFRQPGSGRIYGLQNITISDTYESIFNILKGFKEDQLSHLKKVLIKQKKEGQTICLKTKDGNPHQQVNQFLNGLNLLLDFEVARRRTDGDKFKELPMLPNIVYLLENFQKSAVLEDFFIGVGGQFLGGYRYNINKNHSIWSGDLREDFIKIKLIPNQNEKAKKEIREKLTIFHKDEEKSSEEYDSSDEEKSL